MKDALWRLAPPQGMTQGQLAQNWRFGLGASSLPKFNFLA